MDAAHLRAHAEVVQRPALALASSPGMVRGLSRSLEVTFTDGPQRRSDEHESSMPAHMSAQRWEEDDAQRGITDVG
jgi:hypothetical protein